MVEIFAAMLALIASTINTGAFLFLSSYEIIHVYTEHLSFPISTTYAYIT